MKPGQVVLFRFPQADLGAGKLRPALCLGRLPGPFGDVLLCMVSTQLHQEVPGFDEVIAAEADDFASSGLKAPSLVRTGRVAVAERAVIEGAIGEISRARLQRVFLRLQSWLEELKTA